MASASARLNAVAVLLHAETAEKLAQRAGLRDLAVIPHATWGMSDEAKRRVTNMHAVMRNYSGKGAKELFEILDKHKSDVEGIMRSIKGFVSYTIVHTDVGGFTLSVFQDKAGTDESVRKASDWVKQNAADTGVSPPAVSEGTVGFQVN